MAKTGKHKKRFGLIGKDISYSFSKTYFSNKFKDLGFENHSYENFDIQDISLVKEVFNKKDLFGLNVTIPYKEAIIPYLDDLEATAKSIGAVNTIKFSNKKIVGYNTDAYGFKKSLLEKLEPNHQMALILGTGGASKAIAHVLGELGIEYKFVSRRPNAKQFSYDDLNEELISKHLLIINCTPLGTYPNVNERPAIPYDFLTASHYLFDLIYNPSETAFLKMGRSKDASIQNGLKMLEYQAEKSWEIWNS